MVRTVTPLRIVFTLGIISQLLLALIVPARAGAAVEEEVVGGVKAAPGNLFFNLSPSPVGDGQIAETSLSVSILSSPWVMLDSNDPQGLQGQVPQVFVVEGQVTNLGAEPAENVLFSLDYNEDPANHWTLLPGENPVRGFDLLAPGEVAYAYWFASYSLVPNTAHSYSLSAVAENAPLVTTSDNFYGNPEPGYTVKTRSALSTGNSGLTQASTDIVVGTAFTITVIYDLGSNPVDIQFSPAGNVSFNPGGYQLTASSVRFYTDHGTWEQTIPNRLYFPVLDSQAQNAEVTFVFLTLLPSPTSLCPYGAVSFSSNRKYDQFYCDAEAGSEIPLEATLNFTLEKNASRETVLQGEVLTYTIVYTNPDIFTLSSVWIWDEIDLALASVITPTISPTPDPVETTPGRVAWYVGQVPAYGQPGSSGSLTFSVRVDAAGQDIPDQTPLLNTANFGVNPGSLPASVALSDTVLTLVQAPIITAYKTDGLDFTEPGNPLTYALQASNSGAVTAYGVVITDVLPVEVSLAGTPSPAPDFQDGQTLVWNSLGSLPPDESFTIDVPVVVAPKAAGGTVLENYLAVAYENHGGHAYAIQTASDLTLVNAPLFTLGKSAAPDPVFVGQPLTYTLAYANIGDAGATNVIITDTVPLSTTYQACSGAPCSLSAGVVTWLVGQVAAGADETVSFTVLVDELLPGGSLVTNQVYGIVSDQTYPLAGEPVETLVQPLADLGIEKADAPDPVLAGGVLTYTLSYINLGPSIAESVVITDLLPAPVVFDRVIYQPPYLSGPVQAGQSLTWTAMTLPAGESGEIVYTVLVDAQALSPIGNTAAIHSATADLDFEDNQDTEWTLVSTPETSNLYGWVYEDVNRNAVRDPGETGIADVCITLDDLLTTTTDAEGWYAFTTTAAGLHVLVETDADGYISTTPNAVQVDVVPGSDYQVDFGDVWYASTIAGIKATVFDDLDRDGLWAPGEPYLPGVVLTLDSAITATTDLSGTVAFFVDTPGTHTVVEADPAGYVSTTPNQVQVEVALGQDYDLYFGDALVPPENAAIYGTVFDDLDQDGAWDAGEAGIPGVTLTLDGVVTATTDASGSYIFWVETAGVHTVVETNPVGYASTTPDEVHVWVDLGNAYIVDFGDMAVCACPPDAFEEDDVGSQAQPITLGLPGVQEHTFCDDATDWVTFEAEAGKAYTLTTESYGQRADTFLALYDTDGTTLLAANDDYRGMPDFSSQIVWEAPAAGLYYMHVTNRLGLTGCGTAYRLWVAPEIVTTPPYTYLPLMWKQVQNHPLHFSPPSPEGIISHTCPDAYEVDDTWEQAAAIALGEVQVHSFDSNPALFAADKDVLGFDVADHETVIFSVSALTGTQTLLELFDADGYALGVSGTTQLAWQAPEAGRYYLSVSPLTQAFGCADVVGYALRWELPAAPPWVYLPLINK